MILVTWNVNSIKVRLPNVLQYLNEYKPDILVLQETKVTDDAFPSKALQSIGYHSVFCGQKTYNGVAIITKEKPASFILNPVYLDKNEMRSIVVVYENVTILNVYVVNGKSIDSDKYDRSTRVFLRKETQFSKRIKNIRCFKNGKVLSKSD